MTSILSPIHPKCNWPHYHFSLLRLAKIKELTLPCWWGCGEASHLTCGQDREKWRKPWGDDRPRDLSSPVPRNQPLGSPAQKQNDTFICCRAVRMNTDWEQFKGLAVGDWPNKLWSTLLIENNGADRDLQDRLNFKKARHRTIYINIPFSRKKGTHLYIYEDIYAHSYIWANDIYMCVCVYIYIFVYIYKLQLVESGKGLIRARFLSVYLFIWLWALGDNYKNIAEVHRIAKRIGLSRIELTIRVHTVYTWPIFKKWKSWHF